MRRAVIAFWLAVGAIFALTADECHAGRDPRYDCPPMAGQEFDPVPSVAPNLTQIAAEGDSVDGGGSTTGLVATQPPCEPRKDDLQYRIVREYTKATPTRNPNTGAKPFPPGLVIPLRCGTLAYGVLHMRERGTQLSGRGTHRDPTADAYFDRDIADALSAKPPFMIEGPANNKRNSLVTAKFNDHKRGCDNNKFWGISVVVATDPAPDQRPTGIITAYYWPQQPSGWTGA